MSVENTLNNWREMSNINEIIKDSSINVEPIYKVQTDAFGVFDYPFLINTIKNHNITNFLDVGTGDGMFLIKLAQEVNNVIFHGIDINKYLIDKSKAINNRLGLNINFSQAHFGVDKLKSNYDLIMARFAIEHIKEEHDIDIFLTTAYEKLSSNGIFIIIEYYIHELDIEDSIWKEFRTREMVMYKNTFVHPRIALKLPSRLKAAKFRNIKSIINHVSPSTIGDKYFYSLVKEYTKLYKQISPEVWPDEISNKILLWCEKQQPIGEPIFFTSHTIAQKIT